MDDARRKELAQILPDPITEGLLFENGVLDAQAKKSHYDGWKEICEKMGWDHIRRTPAQERYLDGYYSVRRS